MTRTEHRIGDVELQPLLRVARDTTLQRVAAAMEENGVSCVLVGTEPPRVVTDHDLAAAVASGLPREEPVFEVGSGEPVWATSSTTVRDAIALMVGHRIRHLVVLTPTGEVAGVLSLLQATRQLLRAAIPRSRSTRG